MMLATLTGIHYPKKGSLPVIVMEKMRYSLSKFVNSRSIIYWDKKLSILYDVCCGLQYLHTRNPPIVHRDLTPNNILLCSHLRAKITDLGVARTLQATDTKLTQAPGTPVFMPPECVADNPVYGLPLDLFSFGGIILYVCLQQWPSLTSYIKFDSDGTKRILTELERRQQHLDEMVGANEDLKPLAISCLDDNPNDRPLVGEALEEIKQVKMPTMKRIIVQYHHPVKNAPHNHNLCNSRNLINNITWSRNRLIVHDICMFVTLCVLWLVASLKIY